MSKVIAGFSMSLDGFVADPDDGTEHVFKWYSAGGTDAEVMAGDNQFGMSREGAEFIEEAGRAAGVLVTARRTFDIAHAWGGKHPMGVPMVVVTHTVPEEWVGREGSPFTFVTDGVPAAIDVARADRWRQGRRGGCSQRHPAVPAPGASGCHSHRPGAGSAGRWDPAVRSPDHADRAAGHRSVREPARQPPHLPSHQIAATPRPTCRGCGPGARTAPSARHQTSGQPWSAELGGTR